MSAGLEDFEVLEVTGATRLKPSLLGPGENVLLPGPKLGFLAAELIAGVLTVSKT